MGSEQKYVINQLADITYKTVGYPGVDNIYIELYSDNPSSEIKKTLNVLLNVRHFGSSRKRGQGTGKQIVEYLLENCGIKEVCVNEQNPQAKGFYEHMGFEVYRRTETDEQGNAFPILYMKYKK